MNISTLEDDKFNDVASVDDLMPIMGPDGNARYEIWFSGINTDTKRASYHVTRGHWERLAEGVFINIVNGEGMPPMTEKRRRDLILRHAVRIAAHIYGNPLLSDASAYHNGPVDGVLSLAVLRKSSMARKNIGGVLTIYHSVIEGGVPPGFNLAQPQIEDTFGDQMLEALPDELLILRYFTKYSRKPPAQSTLSLPDLLKLIERTVQKYGSKEALLTRLEEISISMNYRTQFEAAAEAIDRTYAYSQRKQNVFEYYVYWNNVRTGKLAFDGAGWQFAYDSGFRMKLSLNKRLREGVVPSFIGSILPEKGEIDEVIEQGFREFRMADRYLSNITVRKASDTTVHETLGIDQLQGRLKDSWLNGFEFGGELGEDLATVLKMQTVDPSILYNAAQDPHSPRMSGVQLKLAGHLSADGVLSLANNRSKAFTHIIKPPPPGTKSTVGTMEWYGMALASICELQTEDFAIADIGGHGPTFIAERFDIRTSKGDKRMILVEDFWSINGMRNPQHKYTGDVLDVAKLLMLHSTNTAEDGPLFFKQVLFSWLIVNSDLHLKNMMMIKVGNADLTGYDEVRLSSAYDMFCTNVYPNDPRSAALKMGGAPFYTLAGFKELGRILKMKPDLVDYTIKRMIVKLIDGCDVIYDNVPEIVRRHDASMMHMNHARTLMKQRCKSMVEEIERKKTTVASPGRLTAASDTLSFSAGDDNEATHPQQAVAPAPSRRMPRPPM